MDSGQNSAVPCLGVDLAGEEIVHVDLYEPANQKATEPMCHLGQEVAISRLSFSET